MTRRCRTLATLLVAIGACLATAAADVPGERFLQSARAMQAAGDVTALSAHVASDRDLARGAVSDLLGSGSTEDLSLAAALASAFGEAFGDDRLSERVATFRGWTLAQRERWDAAMTDKEQAMVAFAEGRLDEAGAGFARLAELFGELGDRQQAANVLSSLGTVAVVRGESRLGLERLERALAEARRAGDRVLVGIIALSRAYALDDLGETDEALASLEEALRIGRDANDPELEQRAQINLGALYERVGRLDDARDSVRRAATIASDSGDAEGAANAWFNLGVLDGNAGDVAAKRADWARALELTTEAGLDLFSGEIHLGLAQMEREAGAWSEDRQHLDRARALLAEVSAPQILARLELGEAHHRMARGRYADALPFIARAERQLVGLDARTTAIVAAAASAVAHYYLGNYTQAEAALRRGLEEALKSGHASGEANCRSALGFLLFQAGDSVEGLAELERAATIHRELDRPQWTQDLNLIGFLRFRSGDLAGARKALEQAIEGFRSRKDPTGELESLADLARVELAEGGPRRAIGLRRLAEAAAIARRVDDPLGMLSVSLLEAEAAIDARDADATRQALARADAAAERTADWEYGWKVHFLRGRLSEFEGDLDAAAIGYRRAIAAVERRRARMPGAVGRAATLDDRFAPYRRLAQLLRVTGQTERSWEVARAGKARTFVESLLPPLFDPMRDEALPAMLADAGFAPTSPSVEPADAGEPISGTRIRSLLRRGERLVDLYLDGEQLHAYVVSADRVVVRSLPLPATTGDLAATARWPGRPTEDDRAITMAWRGAVRELGRHVLEPLADDLEKAERLVIVPNGLLHALPFAALEFEGQPLARRYEIVVLPAAETLVSRLREARGRGLVAFGDPAVEPRLPGAEREARAVARTVPHGRAWVGDAATEARFRQSAPGADRIHLAAHGKIDRLVPARSHLLLGAGEGEDGRLQADEVAAMNLDASLVVLSGCKTAVESNIARADGPADERIGLPRAFLTAGAGSVIAGLWEVDDQAARMAMSVVYEGLERRDAGGAVSSLQRRILDGEGTESALAALRHPYYWAGLVAYGAGFARADDPAER